MSQVFESLALAWKDWKHERLLSLCAVLALASMLAPLLVLQGLKNGVTQGMRERLLRDPTTLIITPKSDAGSFSREFIRQLADLRGANFAIGRTRDMATDQTFENPATGRLVSLALEPAAQGEPVLARYAVNAPLDGETPELVLASPAAAALGAKPGSELTARLGRRTPEGKLESFAMKFRVAAILPPTAADRRIAFVPLSLLEDMEDYRDFIAVPRRGLAGQPAPGERSYASFRLYAKELDDVEKLAEHLAGLRIEVSTKSRDIAAIRSLEAAINQVILIISIAVGAGFAAFMLSSSEGNIRRKRRMLGMLRLLGFRRLPLMCYPFCQSLLTAACGFFLSLAIYFGVSFVIEEAFADRGGLACSLGFADGGFAVLVVVLIAFVSSAAAAWQAATLEPSMVIREA